MEIARSLFYFVLAGLCELAEVCLSSKGAADLIRSTIDSSSPFR